MVVDVVVVSWKLPGKKTTEKIFSNFKKIFSSKKKSLYRFSFVLHLTIFLSFSFSLFSTLTHTHTHTHTLLYEMEITLSLIFWWPDNFVFVLNNIKTNLGFFFLSIFPRWCRNFDLDLYRFVFFALFDRISHLISSIIIIVCLIYYWSSSSFNDTKKNKNKKRFLFISLSHLTLSLLIHTFQNEIENNNLYFASLTLN